MAGPDPDRSDFRVARQAGGLLVLVGAVILALLDSFQPDYTLDPLSFGLMLGTGAMLLGVDPLLGRLNK